MNQHDIDQLLKRGVQHQAAGRLSEAEELYRQILARQSDNADAMQLLGILENAKGHPQAAVELLTRAIALAPHKANYHCNLAFVLAERERYEEAINSYRQALVLKPDYPEVLNNLGNSLRHTGKIEEAIAAQRRAITLRPNYFEAYNNLGNAFVSIGEYSEAIASFRSALSFHRSAEIYTNLGLVLNLERQFDEAVPVFANALRLSADYPRALLGMADALKGRDDAEQAIEIYQQVLAKKLTATDEAEVSLGNALKNIGRVDEAIAAYRRAQEFNPTNVAAGSNLVFTSWYSTRYDAAAILEEHRDWDRRYGQSVQSSIGPHDNDRDPDRRLRIGYVSPDFRQHATAFNTVPLLSNHRHEEFEIFCYASVKRPDAITERLRGYADLWRDVAKVSDEQLAEQIRVDRVDILVDFSMHTSDGRPMLFARKPAPVQVAFIAQPGSTGMKAMDYRLTDPYLDPPGETDQFYSESSIRLPDSFWCFDPLIEPISTNPLPAIQNGYVTFGCLNNFCKINDDVLSLWSKVLKVLPTSRLLMRCPTGSARQHVLEVLDIDRRRIDFVNRQPREAHLRTYHAIDIALDTFPYNGHMTSLESLWMGVPVVNLVGRTVMGRAGLSQLTNLGLTEWIAREESDFVQIAAQWAGDLPCLAELRASLRERMEKSPLMDAPRYTRNVESAYRQMWRQYCQ